MEKQGTAAKQERGRQGAAGKGKEQPGIARISLKKQEADRKRRKQLEKARSSQKRPGSAGTDKELLDGKDQLEKARISWTKQGLAGKYED